MMINPKFYEGLEAVVYVALNSGAKRLSCKEISASQSKLPRHLEPILQLLVHKNILKAAKALRTGHLVGVPTETVYGLAADATNDKAVAKIYEIKERPQFNPLIIHVASIAQARKYGQISTLAEQFIHAF